MGRFAEYGPFLAITILFFLAEIGDKTQIATVVLAAKYNETLWLTLSVIAGTTFGMLLVNVPVIFAGKWIMERHSTECRPQSCFHFIYGFGGTYFGVNEK